MSTKGSSGALSFVASARLQRYLGRELIADPNLAVIEFVKNAYDAGASRAVVDFTLDATVRQLRVYDDGVGMDLTDFSENWMRPGFSEKSPDAPKPTRARGRSQAEKRRASRHQLGEKGLGRLASGRLGDLLEVYSRRSASEPWLHVTFDWTRFDDMTKAMSDIAIPYDDEAPSFDLEFSSGTVIVISGLRLRWEGRVPGRPVPGRSRTRLGRLKQDLTWLLRPLNEDAVDFEVEIRSDQFDSTLDLGVISPDTAVRDADYTYDFHLEVDEQGRVTVKRRLRRSAELATALNEKRSETFRTMHLDAEAARRLNRPQSLACGPISGTFLYTPPPKGRRAAADSAVGHGVLLYRDGALVEPYGIDGNDWVGVEARKAQRQGHALIQPVTLSGEVRITRAENPELIDMANRQGLIENDAASEFVAHVQAEFRDFEDLIEPELERRNYKSKRERAAEGAEQRLALARVRMRAVSHSLRQPLLGLTGEMKILEQLARRDDVPEDVRQQMHRVSKAAVEYVQRAEVQLARLAELKLPEYGDVLPRQLVDDAIAEAAGLLSDHKVELTVQVESERPLVLPVALVVDALAELLKNAAEAPRPRGRTAMIKLTAFDHGTRDVAIEVADNGTGLDGVNALTPLSDVVLATKARPSGGLMMVEDSVTIIRGTVELVRNGSDGATVLAVLPGRLDGSVETGADG